MMSSSPSWISNRAPKTWWLRSSLHSYWTVIISIARNTSILFCIFTRYAWLPLAPFDLQGIASCARSSSSFLTPCLFWFSLLNNCWACCIRSTVCTCIRIYGLQSSHKSGIRYVQPYQITWSWYFGRRVCPHQGCLIRHASEDPACVLRLSNQNQCYSCRIYITISVCMRRIGRLILEQDFS